MNGRLTRAILLVEDDDNDVVFMKRAMGKVGIEHLLRVTTNGQQAIDYFEGVGEFGDRARYPLPSVVLLDLRLPHVMGLDVLKWIRLRHVRTIVVIVISSSKHEKDVHSAYQAGANAYLVKPGDPRELEALVDLINRFWLTANQTSAAAS